MCFEDLIISYTLKNTLNKETFVQQLQFTGWGNYTEVSLETSSAAAIWC